MTATRDEWLEVLPYQRGLTPSARYVLTEHSCKLELNKQATELLFRDGETPAGVAVRLLVNVTRKQIKIVRCAESDGRAHRLTLHRGCGQVAAGALATSLDSALTHGTRYAAQSPERGALVIDIPHVIPS